MPSRYAYSPQGSGDLVTSQTLGPLASRRQCCQVLLTNQPAVSLPPTGTQWGKAILQGKLEWVTFTYDVVATVGAGVVLEKPWVHTFPVESVGARDNSELLEREREDTWFEKGWKWESNSAFSPPGQLVDYFLLRWCPPAPFPPSAQLPHKNPLSSSPIESQS